MSSPHPWPAAAVELKPIGWLKPFARNARKHPPAQVAQLRASLAQWGWTVPVLADESGELIAGHGRLLAAEAEGLAEIPVMIARGWSAKQKQAYRIADNRLTETGGWDDELLRGELADLAVSGFDATLTGFDVGALGELGIPGYELEQRLSEADVAPEPPKRPVVSRGELWLLGDHRLVCGDSTEAADVARCLQGGVLRPNLMVTDPPYGVDYDPKWRHDVAGQIQHRVGHESLGVVTNDHQHDWREVWELFPGDVAYVWHAGIRAASVSDSLAAVGFNIRAQIIWAKQALIVGRGNYHWKHEPCWYAVRKGAKNANWLGGRKQSTLWEIAARMGFHKGGKGDDRTGHSTQKPVECMRRPMLNHTRPGEAVYDPFLGSGTTMIAAEMEGRACYGLEIEPSYAQLIIERWQAYAGATARRDDGVTLAELTCAAAASLAAE